MSAPLVIHIVNGPNLNLLGKREPEVYGTLGWADYLPMLETTLADLSAKQGIAAELRHFQSNHEGALLDYLHQFGFEAGHGFVINAGAYSHTSIALGDAVRAISAPCVEVHLSNVVAREAYRHFSHVAAASLGSIAGLGIEGYHAAIRFLFQKLQ